MISVGLGHEKAFYTTESRKISGPAYIRLPNSESRISNHATAAKLCKVISLNLL